ncbi:hypothetical protein DFJ58DRAFT_842964 [Suillus subalutaceus]|uniref:uncharacterized protein n=1 Tax=Suillus subalutaceus TaxID=48586 RepID=UPI001B8613A3|nr:uncharacterized protein DFJ58DRAFT_842964 [Suillus subalutaceus]KAG1848322.1 hypothetical protein DFJ58DRAFT_842964 [Suillus subalutaceus]
MASEVDKCSLVFKDAISQVLLGFTHFSFGFGCCEHERVRSMKQNKKNETGISRADPEEQAGSMRDEDNQVHMNFEGDFNFIKDGFGVAEGSLEERYEGAGMCYSEDGLTFLDVFDADEYAEYRKENLFYPFASKEEWEIGDFLLRSPLSMAAIDVFLKLPLIQKLQLSFSNTRELHSHAEMLPSRPSWKLYSEWMTGDAAWEMQTQFPRGATVLGAVLSSNKTNITTMTGARITHPLLLGLANICMCTHTKLSSKAFLLMALLPIPKYLHPNQCMRGMLEDCLIHQCLSIVLKPLMKVAEVGIMMSDPVGNAQHCFTPLTAFIVDTPEAAMLAFFGIPLVPVLSRLASSTALLSIPTISRRILAPALNTRLNGVSAPFWIDWLLADPSIFLMSEPLHHWHKEFFDHDCQWCLVIVGASEHDFRFSILQPVTGYHHFAGGISKLKQVTGRGHRDIQRYIIGLISGAAPRHFVITICALMDVRYLAQCPAPNDDLLPSIDQSLSTFHDNKDIILTSELLQSITSGTRNVGALIQWSADATEHAHISEIKDPARRTNNNDYNPQICQHLDQDEKLLTSGEVPEEEAEENEAIDCDKQEQDDPRTTLLEEMNHTRVTIDYFSKAKQIVTVRDGAIPHPPRTFIAGGTAIHLNYTPSRTGVSIDDVATDFNLPDLRVALSEFLLHDTRERGAIYMQMSFHNSRVTLPAQTVHASPPGPEWPKGRKDTVLVNVEGGFVWLESGLTDEYSETYQRHPSVRGCG